MDLFIRNIRQLVTVAAHGKRALTGPAMNDPGLIVDAGVLCRDGKIAWAGPMAAFPGLAGEDVPEIDATGRVVLPGFVDSHTHMMFAGDRAEEFGMRSQGATYQEIAEQGGGILSTIRHVRAATKKELKRSTSRHLMAMMKHGTTAVEIKTGYGLSMDAEVRMLEGIHELGEEEMATVVGTFLGAHAVPPEFTSDPEAYVRLIIDTMIPYAGKRSLAAFCDVFCERGYFDARQTEEILLAGKAHGMLPKIHAEELTHQGGAELAGRIGAVSADHLEKISAQGIEALRQGGVVAGLLPGVSFFLNHGYAPARAMIDAGVAVAIASDFNPGSCMSHSMPMMMTIACTHMKMTPAEALVASTLNGAAALNLSATHGSIEVGKQADLLVADIPDYRYLAYHFGANHIRHTIKNGTILEIP
ncbi:MAG: imidazolonepropionase [Ignavibacteriae bacterium]|nr:imidazolonepropionase [Ignavibacteriota bacterium]